MVLEAPGGSSTVRKTSPELLEIWIELFVPPMSCTSWASKTYRALAEGESPDAAGPEEGEPDEGVGDAAMDAAV